MDCEMNLKLKFMKYAIRVLQETLSELNDLVAAFSTVNGENIDILPDMKNDISNAISILKKWNKTETQNDSESHTP